MAAVEVPKYHIYILLGNRVVFRVKTSGGKISWWAPPGKFFFLIQCQGRTKPVTGNFLGFPPTNTTLLGNNELQILWNASKKQNARYLSQNKKQDMWLKMGCLRPFSRLFTCRGGGEQGHFLHTETGNCNDLENCDYWRSKGVYNNWFLGCRSYCINLRTASPYTWFMCSWKSLGFTIQHSSFYFIGFRAF
jgi:hypothetical protein